MEPFNLSKSAREMTDLTFICVGCGSEHNMEGAKKGCCANEMFHVAKIIFRNPYRTTGDPDDGYKINNPGSQGEIGESGLGTTRFRKDEPGYDDYSQNLYVPKDGSPYDDKGTGQDSTSDAFLDGPEGDYSALSSDNKEQPQHIGPHNMQPSVKWKKGDLFDRIRKQRKEQ